jgi:HEAT repeat protein
VAREQLPDLAVDVGRLLAAGVAEPDARARLRRHLAALRELARKVPALTRLADALAAVADAETVLNLLPLLRQARAALAAVAVDGELRPLPPSGPWSCPAPTLEIYPVVHAWRKQDSVRVELVRPLVESGWAGDLRLLQPLLEGLEDRYDSAADYLARHALPAFGKAILPELRPGLAAEDERRGVRHLWAVCAIDPARGARLCRAGLAAEDVRVRGEALRCLARATPEDARTVALDWLAQQTNRRLRKTAWEVLNEVGPGGAEALPVLVAALRKDRHSPADGVLAAVGRPAVLALVELLSSPDLDIVGLAVSALRRIGPGAAAAVPALVAGLRARDTAPASHGALAAHFASALEHIGPAAREAVPDLLALYRDRKASSLDRSCARRALVAIGGASPAVLRPLIDVLEHPEGQQTFGEVVSVLEEVCHIGPPAKSAVPALVGLLDYPATHWQAHRTILEALGNIGSPAARAALPALEKSLQDEEVRVRRAAAVALAGLGPAGRAALPVLEEAVRVRDWWWVMYGASAAEALGRLGRRAVPLLTEALRAEDVGPIRKALGQALAQAQKAKR